MLDRPYACFMAYFRRTEGANKAGCTNLIICDRLMEDYASYYAGLEDKACITTRADFESFDIKMKLEDNPAAVLENTHYPLSPLFRFITCGELGLYGLAEGQRVRAEDQLAENPFFFKMYKSGFPVTLEELLPTKD
jgi:hypothetical protein